MAGNTTKGFVGQNSNTTDTSTFNAADFHIQQAINLMSTGTLVQVKAVTATGKVEGTGTLSVQPLVNMVDGQGQATPHGKIQNVPYHRYGAGNKAIIMDPKVGDIGMVVFADRDISSVKKNKKASNPGSRRRFDMADGMYAGTLLSSAPTCYIQFTDDNHIILSPDNGTTIIDISANQIKMKVGDIAFYVRPGRIDLGKLGAPHAVMTADGPSEKVFAVINEVDS